MKIKPIIFASAVTLFLCTAPAGAENQAADFLVRIGKMELKKGRVKDAVHEFSKALLLEPGNKEALHQLWELGYPGGIYTKVKPNPSDRQVSAAEWYGDVQPNIPEFEAWQRRQHARKVFRSERILYEDQKDRGSYLREYPQLGQNGIRHVSDSLADTTVPVAIYETPTRTPPRTAREVLIERYLDAHEGRPEMNSAPALPGTDPNRFPNRMIQGSGPASSPVESQTDFYDLQGMIDFSRDNETAFFYWLDDDPKELYEIQFEHQDELIAVLDQYLRVREEQIQAHEDRLLGTELELLQTRHDLAAQVEANNDLHEVYHQVVRLGDDQAYYISQENSYMQYLERKLASVRFELSERSEKMDDQRTELARLEAELEAYRRQVDQLLTEREDLLQDVTERVDELQRIGDLNVRP